MRSTTASAVRERSRTSPATWSAKPKPWCVIASVTAGLRATSSTTFHSSGLASSRSTTWSSSWLSNTLAIARSTAGLSTVSTHEPLELGAGEDPLGGLLDDAVGEHALGEPVDHPGLLRAVDDVVEHLGGEHLVEHPLEHGALRDVARGDVDERAGQRLVHRALGPRAREHAVGRDLGGGGGEQRVERVEREPRAGALAGRDDEDHRARDLAADGDAHARAAREQRSKAGSCVQHLLQGRRAAVAASAALSIAEATITRLTTKSQNSNVNATPSDP